MTRRDVALAAAALLVVTLAGCSSTDHDGVPAPTPSPSVAPIEVPVEPTHVQYVPSDLTPPGVQGPGIWNGDQAQVVIAASIDGLALPLPPGAEYDFDDIDADVGWEIGTLESAVAFQWHCAWLAEWDAARDAGDDALEAEIAALTDRFWTLPHIDLLEVDGVTFRDQQVEAAPEGADLRVWSLRNC
ncbi:hypothetical protein [Agrococcus jejuensis]|uniref:Uncharacterized protein n=1 Tax=Agrococcus jejuensis TaxID=399736 RepID=A0A1G8FWR5_9MICO|nr:hypothetical protein [Agrococcus jejuensis]SDH86583.1 hypothetical protein SAMN04489720_2654 [Agrococcus jejuensis]